MSIFFSFLTVCRSERRRSCFFKEILETASFWNRKWKMVLMHAPYHLDTITWVTEGFYFDLLIKSLRHLRRFRLHQIHFCSSTAYPGPYPLLCALSSLRLQDRQFEIIPSYSSSEQQIASFANFDPTTSCRPLLTTSRRTRAAYLHRQQHSI